MQQAKVFILTFLAYFGQTSMRYGWAYSKPQLQDATGITMKEFGVVDFFYVSCYSFGFIVLGSFVHKTTLKIYVSTGISAACISYMFYPIYFSITKQQSFLLLILFMSLNGFFQATVWPGVIGIFGNWFKKGKNGTLIGIWAMSGNIGNIYASNICNILQLSQAYWLYNFLATGLIGIVVAILIISFLDQHPKKQSDLVLGLMQKQQTKQIKKQKTQEKKEQSPVDNQKYGIFSLLRIPKVLRYVAALACLKGCFYGLAFWLPTYFYNKGEEISNQKGFIISMYDLGTIIGTITLGYIADRYNKRAMLLSPLLFLSMILMLVITLYLQSAWQYYISMILTGICIGGPYYMICTVITIDLGSFLNQKSSIARISSLIEGVASLCSATSMLIIPLIPFEYTLYIFAAESILGVVVLFPLSFEEAKNIPFLKKYFDADVKDQKEDIQLSYLRNTIQSK